MRSFFKMFFASCLGTVIGMIALVLIGAFLLVGAVSAIGSKDKVDVAKNSVLTISLAQHFSERATDDPLDVLMNEEMRRDYMMSSASLTMQKTTKI